MNVLHATIHQLHLLIPLFDSYRQFYDQKSDLPGASLFLTERLSSADLVIFLAVDASGTALGFVQLYPSFSSVSMKRLWILNDLFVTQSARGQGVAKALLKRSAHLAEETNAKGLVLETGVDNLSAKRLYETSGWIKEKRFDRYYLNLK
jgi:ribosomal protein S18 acetylase RimI-like enzyme